MGARTRTRVRIPAREVDYASAMRATPANSQCLTPALAEALIAMLRESTVPDHQKSPAPSAEIGASRTPGRCRQLAVLNGGLGNLSCLERCFRSVLLYVLTFFQIEIF